MKSQQIAALWYQHLLLHILQAKFFLSHSQSKRIGTTSFAFMSRGSSQWLIHTPDFHALSSCILLLMTEPQDYQSQTLQLFPVGEPEMIGKGQLAMGPKWEEETGMAIHLVVPCGSYYHMEQQSIDRSRVLFGVHCTQRMFLSLMCASSAWLVRKHVTANAHKTWIKMIWLLNRKHGWMTSPNRLPPSI